jgi:hypothetical protein
VPELVCPFEEVDVQQSAKAVFPVFVGDNDAINIEEFVEPAAEPQEVSAFIVVALPKGQQKRCAWLDEGGNRRR